MPRKPNPEGIQEASQSDAQATSTASFQIGQVIAELYTLSLIERPANLWRKVTSAASIRSLFLLVSTQSSSL